MLIRHIAHAEFLIETESGYRIVTDPYDETCGYPMPDISADAVLVSHQHFDHNAVHTIKGSPRVVDTESITTLEKDIRVTALQAWHDDEKGAKRGPTLLFLLEADGLRVVHLGDLGDDLDEGQKEKLFRPDILMIPVGGHFTIDAKKAAETAAALEARVILPMHYRTKCTETWPITPVEDFLSLYPRDQVSTGMGCLRVTKGDLMCQPKIAVFDSCLSSGGGKGE